jgi:CSLREA domain-containing protein
MKKLFGVAVAAFFLMPATAMAATVNLTVTSTADNTTVDGQCTLREALAVSTAGTLGGTADCPSPSTPSESKIGFSAALGANPVITLTPALQDLQVNTNDVTVTGPATVNGATNSGFRVINSGGINLTLTSMTISNGSESATGQGGGIFHSTGGSLTLNNSTVSGNKVTQTSGSSTGVEGGGIDSSARVTLNNSIVTNNTASATYTGGIPGGAQALAGGVEANGANLTMKNSVASGNQVLASGNGSSGAVEADGGGLRSDGQILIEHSTISGNLASATATGTGGTPIVQGGGLLWHGTDTVDIELSTIANNLMKKTAVNPATGQQLGGGVNDSSTNTANYISDTIAGNGLDPASQASGTISGLNFTSQGGASENFSNTIIASPVGSGATSCFGATPYSTGGTPNVDFPFPMADPGQACFTPGAAIMNVNPQLGALGNNGGATPTMVPAPTSPVIDQGTATDQNDLTQDQRGLTRPVVFPGLIHPLDGSDIGAVEVQQACAQQVTPTTPTSVCPTGGGGAPSNAFTIAGIANNNKNGTAIVTVNVPGAGQVGLSGNGVQTASAHKSVTVNAAGNVQLIVKATGKKKKKLKKKGKVTVTATVTYTPTGGTAASKSTNVKLKKKRHKK